MAEPAQKDAQIVDHLNDAPFHRGEMPINEQTSTYHLFDNLWRWGSVTMASVLMLLILTFCTPLGFFPGLIAGVVVFTVGFFVVKKPTSLETH